jgi:hypothetical protein
VLESTETVTEVPLSEPSCGPVQRTPIVRVLLPTELTAPANQCEWTFTGGAVAFVVVLVVVVVGLAASAGRATAAVATATRTMRKVLRMGGFS